MSNSGFLFSFDGVECAGHVNQIPLIKTILEDCGFEVVTTYNPGGTPYADPIRDMIFFPQVAEEIKPLTVAMLCCASTTQCINHVILPALQTDKIVLCDTFIIGFHAELVSGRYVSEETFVRLIQHVINPYPLLTSNMHTFLFLIPDEVSHTRVLERDNGNSIYWDWIEYDKRVRINNGFRAFDTVAGTTTIDGEQTVESITASCIQVIYSTLSQIEGVDENKLLALSAYI